MKILLVTSLFPNSLEPAKGTFNMQQALQLRTMCDVRVVAPVPWAPPGFGKKSWITLRKIPREENIGGLSVFHPRYFVAPKITRSFYAFYFAFSVRRIVKQLYDAEPFDLIYAPWAYPDGIGSYYISRELGVPIVVGILGTDVNVYTNFAIRRSIIVHALTRCEGVVAVSQALKNKIVAAGLAPDRVVVVMNGVDEKKFCLTDKVSACARTGLSPDNTHILFAGNLYPVKGTEYLLKAFGMLARTLKNLRLVIVGDGLLRNQLEQEARRLEIADRVFFAGSKPHDEIALWMNSCDVFCLPSIHEGCPNVLLEALACGKPVVATRVGGIPEIITSEEYGFLVDAQDAKQLAMALRRALETPWDRTKLRARVEKNTWEYNARTLFSLFESIVRRKSRP